MRSYPLNSPQAAGRIVALTLLADGEVADIELALLDRVAAPGQLGLSRQALQELLDTLRDDLRSAGPLPGGAAGPVDERTLANLLGEIEDPDLRRRVLRLCVQLAEVDDQVHDGEFLVLTTAVQHWGLAHEMFLPSPTPEPLTLAPDDGHHPGGSSPSA